MQVVWNQDEGIDQCRVDSQNDQRLYTNLVCDWSQVGEQNMQSYVQYTTPANSKSLFLASTISLDGVLMYSGTSQTTGVDPFFPTNYSKGTSTSVDSVDSCLGRTDYDGTYYYRTASPCLSKSMQPVVGSSCAQC